VNASLVALLAWAAAVVAVTFVHHLPSLAALLVAALLLSGAGRARLLLRTARGVGPVLALLSLGYLLVGAFGGPFEPGYLVLLNLRVGLLALLTFWMLRDVELAAALARWPAARRWLAIVRSQIGLFGRLAGDYRLARRSRSTLPPTLRQRYLGAAATSLAAMDKAVHNAETVTQAMRSRGALDD
jgi:cobalt/nickel transport system permease protein